MPAFLRDEVLTKAQIDQVADYVLSLAGPPKQNAAASPGRALFVEHCAACHRENGTGNKEFGAPNLTDAIWLYGGDRDTILETITNSRYGVMPPWGPRLSDAEIKAVTLYVHGLGGGEAAPEEE